MDFELSDDQQALVDGLRAVLDGRFGGSALREMIDQGLDRGRWRDLAETGVFALALSEADGGLGLGWTDAALVFEELGRALVPGPLVGTALAAGTIAGAADGTAVVAVTEGDEKPLMLEHLPWADHLLVLDDDGGWIVDPDDVDPSLEARPLDPLTPVARVEHLPRGERLVDAREALDWRRRGAVLTSALQLGLATGSLELAVTHANQREQFGRPIGSFQAIKHLCADMLGRAEVARAAVYMAAVALDDPTVADPDRALSVARILADEAAGANGRDCVQVHGGMGYTWEVDAHLFLKRAWVLETSFGSADHHAEWLAGEVLA